MAKLFICGDIINTNGSQFIGEVLAGKIAQADYKVCNLEGPEVRPGQQVNCPHQIAGTIEYLNTKGFDLFLLANNHITELGEEGLRDTFSIIQHVGALHIGAGLSFSQAYKPLIKSIGGISFGFINVCEAQVGHFVSPSQPFGYAWMGYDGLIQCILSLSHQVDEVVVFVHSGLEHYSIPLPELRRFYRSICDAGASCVVGGHTHTAQGYEYYENKLIIYSLGNFYFPKGRNEEKNSYSVILEFSPHSSVSIETICHSQKDEIVEVSDEVEAVDVNNLCSLLNADYDSRANLMALDAYQNLCGHLLAQATLGEYDQMTPFQRYKDVIKRIFFRSKYVTNTYITRNKLLLRLFENESYRWTIVRALNQMTNN